MRKQNYIRPTLSIVHFQPPLLETISGSDQGGDSGWGHKAKRCYSVYDEFEEDDEEISDFIN